MINLDDKISCIIKTALSDTKINFEPDFINPVKHSQMNGDFPYITFVLGNFQMQPNSLRIKQNIDVFGFVKSHEDLGYKRADLLVTVAKALKKYIKFDSGAADNIFKPYGINALFDKPYAGFRLSGIIGYDMRND